MDTIFFSFFGRVFKPAWYSTTFSALYLNYSILFTRPEVCRTRVMKVRLRNIDSLQLQNQGYLVVETVNPIKVSQIKNKKLRNIG